jgi:hypothetical protein
MFLLGELKAIVLKDDVFRMPIPLFRQAAPFESRNDIILIFDITIVRTVRTVFFSSGARMNHVL